MSTLYELALEQRRALLAVDATTAERLIRAYATVDRDIQARLSALTDLIELRKMNGEEISRAWLQKEERYLQLLDQVEQETARLAVFTGDLTRSAVASSTAAGAQDANTLIAAGAEEAGLAGDFNALPRIATETITSAVSAPSPLSGLLDRITKEMPQDARKRAADALIVGVSTGQGPRVIAANLRAATGVSLNRSLTIARTEGLRAYKNAALVTYRESDVIDGWQWTTSFSARSCVACLAMANTIHSKDEPFTGHVRCRCCPRPYIKGIRTNETSGEDWLREQDEYIQDNVLGRASAEAWRNGEVQLGDFVGRKDHPLWGSLIHHASLEDARKAAVKRSAIQGKIKPMETVDVMEAIRREIEPLHGPVTNALNALLPPGSTPLVSRWNGRVVELVANDTAEAVIRPDGTIEVSAKRLNAPDRWRTYIHELVHAHSPMMSPDVYTYNKGWEEGVVEWLQRTIRPQVLREYQDIDESSIQAAEARWPFAEYVNQMERVREAAGVLDVDAASWYAELLHKRVEDRYAAVMRPVAQAKDAKRMVLLSRANIELKKNLPGEK